MYRPCGSLWAWLGCGTTTLVFEGQENPYSRLEWLKKIFWFDYPDAKCFSQGRWKFDDLGLDPKEGKQ